MSVNGMKGAKSHTVPEEFRIKIEELLNNFRESDTSEICFPASLSNTERRFVHEQATSLGLKSKSYGKGNSRYIKVSKTEVRVSERCIPIVKYFNKGHVKGYLSHHNHYRKSGAFSSSDRIDWVGKHQAKLKHARSSHSQIKISHRYANNWLKSIKRRRDNKRMHSIMTNRMSLPSWAKAGEFIDKLNLNRVVIVSGATGSGKSTQMVQFLLDNPVIGPSCNIIVTQPRRISTLALSDRVSFERGENVGETIGYAIRGESRSSHNTQCLFVTTGVLLRRLLSDPDLTGVTHVFLDEVHERDRNTDFLLIILRDLLSVRLDLHVVLMSATLLADSYVRYFESHGFRSDVVMIEGRTFPVEEFYLDEILELLNYFDGLDRNQKSIGAPDIHVSEESFSCSLCRFQSTDLELFALHAATCVGITTNNNNNNMNNISYPSITNNSSMKTSEIEYDVSQITQFVKASNDKSSSVKTPVQQYHELVSDEEVDHDLLVSLLEYICFDNVWDSKGSILIFFSGWDEISSMQNILQSHDKFSNDHRYVVLPLHSAVPTRNQKLVFQTPPEGAVKIILATNIAETSITINDCSFVIDCGRAKIKTYDEYTKLSHLRSEFITKANVSQRTGRAGRTSRGYCFHLFSRSRFLAMHDYMKPELLRTPLEELGLQVKLLHKGDESIHHFLGKAIEPPSDMAITNAVNSLIQLKALNADDETLTCLGFQLGRLPLHPKLGKMILVACLFGCYDNILTIACLSQYKDPFIIPLNKKNTFNSTLKFKTKFSNNSQSDQVAMLNIFRAWDHSTNKSLFCRENNLSYSTLSAIKDTKRSIHRQLIANGFIAGNDSYENERFRNRFSGVMSVTLAVMVSGYYPSIATRTQGTMKFRSRSEAKVKTHNNSILSGIGRHPAGRDEVMLFNELTKGKMLVTCQGFDDCVPVEHPVNEEEEEASPVRHNHIIIRVGDWILLQVHRDDMETIYTMCARIKEAFNRYIESPLKHLSPLDIDTIDVIVKMIGSLDTKKQGTKRFNIPRHNKPNNNSQQNKSQRRRLSRK